MAKQLKDYQIRVVEELHDFFNFYINKVNKEIVSFLYKGEIPA